MNLNGSIDITYIRMFMYLGYVLRSIVISQNNYFAIELFSITMITQYYISAIQK
jgi:hypothetical protein